MSPLGWHDEMPGAFTPYAAVEEPVSSLGLVLANSSRTPAAVPAHSTVQAGAQLLPASTDHLPPLLLLPCCCIFCIRLQQPFSQSLLCPVTPRPFPPLPAHTLPWRGASNPGVSAVAPAVWAGTHDNNLSTTRHEQATQIRSTHRVMYKTSPSS